MNAIWTSPHNRSLPDYRQRILVMGIINVTPDSFSDGGKYTAVEQACKRVEEMLAGGADVIDVGGESTRPGSQPVDEKEERARVLPVIKALRRTFPDMPLSIDTFKAPVAAAAIEAGADMINDVRGLTHGMKDKAGATGSPMAGVAASCQCPVIIMHNRPAPAPDHFWAAVARDLEFSLDLARQAGIAPRQIWLDPGFGFGKTVAQNLEVLQKVDRLLAYGHPVLLGTSRKSTIGKVLDREVHERLEGSIATNLWGIARGCRMIRIHDVAEFQIYRRMADAIIQGLSYPS